MSTSSNVEHADDACPLIDDEQHVISEHDDEVPPTITPSTIASARRRGCPICLWPLLAAIVLAAILTPLIIWGVSAGQRQQNASSSGRAVVSSFLSPAASSEVVTPTPGGASPASHSSGGASGGGIIIGRGGGNISGAGHQSGGGDGGNIGGGGTILGGGNIGGGGIGGGNIGGGGIGGGIGGGGVGGGGSFAPAPRAPAPRGCVAIGFTDERCVVEKGQGWAVSVTRAAIGEHAATASNCCVQVLPDGDMRELENNYRHVTISGSGNYCYLRSVLLSLVVQVSGDAAAFDAFRHRADLAFPEAKWAALFTSEGVQKANVLAQLGKLRMMNPTDRIHAVAQGTDHDMMQLLKFGRVIGANGHGFGAGGGGATQQTQLAEWFNLSAYSIPETVAATRDVGLNCVGVCPNGRIVRRLNPNAVNQQVFIKTANDAHFNAWVARKVWQQ